MGSPKLRECGSVTDKASLRHSAALAEIRADIRAILKRLIALEK